MHHRRVVGRAEPVGDLTQQRERLRAVERTAAREVRVEGLAVEEFHDEPRGAVGLDAGVGDPHDVLALDAGAHPGLLHELLPQRGFDQGVGEEQLQRPGRAGRDVPHAVHRGHAAPGHGRLDDVALGDHLPKHQRVARHGAKGDSEARTRSSAPGWYRRPRGPVRR